MIYLDNAATTPMAREAADAMLPFLTDRFGNPSSGHRAGADAKKAVSECREKIASMLNAHPDEIYFTSGGTESDNQALICSFESALYRKENKPFRILTSLIEHPAVLRTCEYLKTRGADISFMKCSREGSVCGDDPGISPSGQVSMVSVMFANNETGVLQPVAELAEKCSESGILFHTDAVQAFGHVPVDLSKLPADLLSASAHKFGGPKGIGFLFIRRGVKIPSLLHGGSQERNRRAGTENVAAIAGMGRAAELAAAELESRAQKTALLRDTLQERILSNIPGTAVNGSIRNRLPGILNMTFKGVSAESLLIMLDLEGICVSAGSACSSGSLSPSHVLTSMGLTPKEAFSSLRFSLSHENTEDEITRTVECLQNSVKRLRKMTT